MSVFRNHGDRATRVICPSLLASLACSTLSANSHARRVLVPPPERRVVLIIVIYLQTTTSTREHFSLSTTLSSELHCQTPRSLSLPPCAFGFSGTTCGEECCDKQLSHSSLVHMDHDAIMALIVHGCMSSDTRDVYCHRHRKTWTLRTMLACIDEHRFRQVQLVDF